MGFSRSLGDVASLWLIGLLLQTHLQPCSHHVLSCDLPCGVLADSLRPIETTQSAPPSPRPLNEHIYQGPFLTHVTSAGSEGKDVDLSCRGPVVSPLPQVEETMRWKCAGTFDSCRPVTGIEGNMAGLSARASVQRDASLLSVFSAR